MKLVDRNRKTESENSRFFFLAAFSYVAQGLRRLHVPQHSFTHTCIGKTCTAIRLTLVYAMPSVRGYKN